MSKSQIRHLKQLKQKKYRSYHNEFLAEGLRLCEELLESSYEICKIFFVRSFGEKEREKKLLQRGASLAIDMEETDEETLASFCCTDTPAPVIAWAKEKSHEITDSFFAGRRYLIADNIQDPGNLGTLLRTADAFGWSGAILAGETLELYNPKVLRASMGACFRFPICIAKEDVLEKLKRAKIDYIVSSPKEGLTPPLLNSPEKFALFLGSEAHGLRQDLMQSAFCKVCLPMKETCDSLNVAVAGSILMYLLK